MKLIRRIKIAVFFAYAVFVAFVSLMPGGSASLGDWDKLLHFLTYGVFALLGYSIVTSSMAYLVICLAILAFSGLVEVGQAFVPGRFMSGYDMLANTAGVAVAVFIMRFLTSLRSGR